MTDPAATGATAATAADRLTCALRALHERAGNPTYEQLVRQGQSRSPAVVFTPQSLSDWRNGHSVPSSEQVFQALIQILEALARKHDPGFQRQATAAWNALRAAAWQEKRGNPRGETESRGAAPLAPGRRGPGAAAQDDQVPERTVTMTNPAGVQIGNGNTQNNTFGG